MKKHKLTFFIIAFMDFGNHRLQKSIETIGGKQKPDSPVC